MAVIAISDLRLNISILSFTIIPIDTSTLRASRHLTFGIIVINSGYYMLTYKRESDWTIDCTEGYNSGVSRVDKDLHSHNFVSSSPEQKQIIVNRIMRPYP